MLKWWRLPLYPDWINAENTIIWLVTFQIQIQIQIQIFKFKINLCVCRFLLQNVFLKLINVFVFFVSFSLTLFWFHKDREITKNLFTLAESNLGGKKTVVHSLELWRNFIGGNETGSPGRAVSLHLARSGSQSEHRIRCILPARGACHTIKPCIACIAIFSVT